MTNCKNKGERMARRWLTTVQFDLETDRKLRLIAQKCQRSKAAQIRFMVNIEYQKLVTVEPLLLLPAVDESEKNDEV
jgi:hypothetical protein